MQIIHGFNGLNDGQKGRSVALGNFDGVHKGHAAVIRAAHGLAPDAPTGVVSFDPHPRQFFAPDTDAFLLTPLARKAAKVAALGVDTLYVLPFDRALASRSPGDFVREILVEGLGIRGVAVGSDFRFGAQRAGGFDTLEKLGRTFGFATAALTEVADEDGGLFSSSAARNALREGRPEEAAAILGSAHVIEGEVLKGDQRGRTIGFSTANLSLDGLLAPRFGVYAIRVTLPDGRLVPGVANIGMRPTFEKTVPILEAHLFDFSEDIYGQTVSVALHHFIRAERKFDGLESLKEQIAADARSARGLLADAR